MTAKAVIKLPFESEKFLLAIENALCPEAHQQKGTRSKATIAIQGRNLLLEVESEDTVALRTSLNAYLRWINSAISVLETAK